MSEIVKDLPPDAFPDSNEIRFGKLLASNEKKIRDRAVLALEFWLKQRKGLTELDLLKIWKGLFYCMWMCDKVPIQMHLAERLSSMLHVFEDDAVAVLWFQTFASTMRREWEGLDHLRLDKYYSFIRKAVFQSFEWIKHRGWAADAVSKIMLVLESEILKKLPNGLRFHVADLFLDELSKAGAQDISTATFKQLLHPFYKVLCNSKDKHFFKRTKERVFEQLLDFFVEEPEASERPCFEHVDLKGIQAWIFSAASSEETAEKYRAQLYDLHKKFQQKTGVQFCKEQANELLLSEEKLLPQSEKGMELCQEEELHSPLESQNPKKKKKRKRQEGKNGDVQERKQLVDEPLLLSADVSQTEKIGDGRAQKPSKKKKNAENHLLENNCPASDTKNPAADPDKSERKDKSAADDLDKSEREAKKLKKKSKKTKADVVDDPSVPMPEGSEEVGSLITKKKKKKKAKTLTEEDSTGCKDTQILEDLCTTSAQGTDIGTTAVEGEVAEKKKKKSKKTPKHITESSGTQMLDTLELDDITFELDASWSQSWSAGDTLQSTETKGKQQVLSDISSTEKHHAASSIPSSDVPSKDVETPKNTKTPFAVANLNSAFSKAQSRHNSPENSSVMLEDSAHVKPDAGTTKKKKKHKKVHIQVNDENLFTPSSKEEEREGSTESPGISISSTVPKKKHLTPFRSSKPDQVSEDGRNGLTPASTASPRSSPGTSGFTPQGSLGSPFIPSNKFQGAKPGYSFKKGDEGIGYYVDERPLTSSQKKKKRISMGSTPGGKKVRFGTVYKKGYQDSVKALKTRVITPHKRTPPPGLLKTPEGASSIKKKPVAGRKGTPYAHREGATPAT